MEKRTFLKIVSGAIPALFLTPRRALAQMMGGGMMGGMMGGR